jgi:hypothetical protein
MTLRAERRRCRCELVDLDAHAIDTIVRAKLRLVGLEGSRTTCRPSSRAA